MEKKRILCLDLDGTVRRSKSGKTFIEGPDDIELIPGMKELIWKYREDGWIPTAFSNQAGIAHGHKSVQMVIDEMEVTASLLKEGYTGNHDHPISSILFCPFDHRGTIEEFSLRSLLRKPGYGMLAVLEYQLVEANKFPDWDNSLFVGDRPEDEQCAKAAGIPFMWAHNFLNQQFHEGHKPEGKQQLSSSTGVGEVKGDHSG